MLQIHFCIYTHFEKNRVTFNAVYLNDNILQSVLVSQYRAMNTERFLLFLVLLHLVFIVKIVRLFRITSVSKKVLFCE